MRSHYERRSQVSEGCANIKNIVTVDNRSLRHGMYPPAPPRDSISQVCVFTEKITGAAVCVGHIKLVCFRHKNSLSTNFNFFLETKRKICTIQTHSL